MKVMNIVSILYYILCIENTIDISKRRDIFSLYNQKKYDCSMAEYGLKESEHVSG